MIRSKNTGSKLAAGLALALLLLSPGAAEARRHHGYSHSRGHGHARQESAPAAAAAPSASKPQLVGSYGDWGAYTAQGKSKVCYALAQPKERQPSSLKKDQAYIFVSDRPAEGVHNEISVIMGVPLKEGQSDAKAMIGSATFDLVTKGQNAWLKNAADEAHFLDVVKRGQKLVVRGVLVRGGTATDSYSLAGLAQALDRVVKECR
jgi:hypothetical protein